MGCDEGDIFDRPVGLLGSHGMCEEGGESVTIPNLLDGVRVVELAGRPSIRIAASICASMGAEVIRVVSDLTDEASISGAHPLVGERAMSVAWDRDKIGRAHV